MYRIFGKAKKHERLLKLALLDTMMFIEHKILKKAKKPEKKLQDVKTKRQEGSFVNAKVKMLHCLQR